MAEGAGAAGRFGRALSLTRRACERLAPLVRALYDSGAPQVELKADASAFTLADGLVQEMLARHLFGSAFKGVVGEEDAAQVNISSRPYSVSSLPVPEALQDSVDAARTDISALGGELAQRAAEYDDCTVFIDPIDGTREFSSQLGAQCTILVGFAVAGAPMAGLVYRPLAEPASWAAGCSVEGIAEGELDTTHALATCSTPHAAGLLTTNGAISPFLEALLSALASERQLPEVAPLRVKAGGVGNKVMCLLEGKAQCYIQDRGVSRWDTCAAQAVLESRGGRLVKLTDLLADGEMTSYRYEATESNLDLNPLARLTRHNSRTTTPAELVGEPAVVGHVKPYANLCGLFALSAKGVRDVERYRKLCLGVAQSTPPAFD